MATTRIYFDKRRQRMDGTYAIKLTMSIGNESRLISLGIFIRKEEWDERTMKVIVRADKVKINKYLSNCKNEADDFLIELSQTGKLKNMSINELKKRIEHRLNIGDNPLEQGGNFERTFDKFAKLHIGRTQEIYLATLKHIRKFVGFYEMDALSFEDITIDWLTEFDNYLKKVSPSKNGRNIHLRNIRAVFNNAIDNEITSFYPFRKFHIKPQETAKRSLSVEQLRELANAKLPPDIEKYRDAFMLIIHTIELSRFQ